jgi:type II secretory pathway component PulF
VASAAIIALVREGRGLADAIEESSIELPPVFLGLIRAGESGGTLSSALRRAAEHAESHAATESQIRAALAYPAIVALAGGGALAIMVGVVLPKFAAVLSDFGQALPPLTRTVLAASRVAGEWGVATLAAMAIAALGVQWYCRSDEGRRVLHRGLLATPGIGTIRSAGATARFTAALAALLECGLSLRTSLHHAAPAVGDAEILARLSESRVRLDAGEALASSLAASGALTPLAVQLVAAGEESGRLPKMLAFAARLEQARADRLTRSGVQLIEPALILALALLVGVVAAAMLQAVYAVRPA